jgi:hypothetical protein
MTMQGQTAENRADTIRLDETRVAWREVDGEVVVIDVNTAEYLTMNGSGALLWAALAEGATEADLADRLLGAYEVSAEQADADVGAFLHTLRERGLVVGYA